MAAEVFAETPSRLLRRVQELEDMEMPSLPSIQHDIDFESSAATSESTSSEGEDEDIGKAQSRGHDSWSDLATPHAVRAQPYGNLSADLSGTSSTTSAPFPPMHDLESANTPSPLAASTARTSTPSTRQYQYDIRTAQRYSTGDKSGLNTHVNGISKIPSPFSSSTVIGTQWHTPAEMSGSFSGDEITHQPRSPANASRSMEQVMPEGFSSALHPSDITGLVDTPLPKRPAPNHVLVARPRRTGIAAPKVNQSPSGGSPSGVQASRDEPLSPIDQIRVPSLTRSEISEDSTAGEARTPEGPSRTVLVATPRSLQDVDHAEPDGDVDHEWTREEQTEHEHREFEDGTGLPDGDKSRSFHSALSTRRTTPGQGRYAASPLSAIRSISAFRSTTTSVLQDLTVSIQNDQSPVPQTPSPAGFDSVSIKHPDSTPRAPLDDTQRRKSHILAVLTSSGLPRRTPRLPVRGTPHPLRRVSVPMTSSSSTSGPSADEPTARSIDFQSNVSQAFTGENDSFVSITSSADLTSDKRATNVHQASMRGNTSFPNILLPTGGAAGAFLRSVSESRADGVKIHKHLNAMNKQLLETNADLAREAEAWRDEAGRLRIVLQEAGVQFDEIDVMANLVDRSTNESHPALQEDTQDSESRDAHLQGLGVEGSRMQERLSELEAQVEADERAKLDLQAGFAAQTEAHAQKFAEICAGFEEQVQELESQLSRCRTESEQLKADKARLQIIAEESSTSNREKELQLQLRQLEQELERFQASVRRHEAEAESLRRELSTFKDERQGILEQEDRLQAKVAELEAQLAEAESLANEGEDDRKALRAELREARAIEVELRGRQADRGVNLADMESRSRESASASEQDIVTGKHEVQYAGAEEERLRGIVEELQETIAIQEQELEAERSKPRLESQDDEEKSMMTALEERLDEAYREIGRLKHQLSVSPQRRSDLAIRDARIQSLEREKSALQQRLARSPPDSTSSPVLPSNHTTPFVHKAIASLRTPKTPGLLKELSWLQSTLGNPDEPVLQAQVEYLQSELHNVNEELDHNFSRLEAAGLSAVNLAEKLAAAEDRIGQLEDEIRALLQRNKASLVLVNAQREEMSREADERLQQALKAVHEQVEQLQEGSKMERRRLQHEQRRLQDAMQDLRKRSEEDVSLYRHNLEMAEAKASSESQRASKLVAVAQQKVEALEKDKAAAIANADRLHQELSRQREAYRQLQKHALNGNPAETSKQAESIRTLQIELRLSHNEVEHLQTRLGQAESELAIAHHSIESLTEERASVMRDLLEFESALKTQHVENRKFGAALRSLQEQQQMVVPSNDADEMERRLDSTRRQLHAAMQQLDVAKTRMTQLEQTQRAESASASADALNAQQARFKLQARDLASQIRYLKAKYTREASFRNALSLQKRYLLLLVGGMNLNEQATLKAIASMGFPLPQTPRKVKSFKSVGLAVLSIVKARNSASKWRAERELKQGAVENHERRRVAS